MRIILLFVLLSGTINIAAQSVLSNSGAKNEALGSPVAVGADEWSIWRNPAGLASVGKPIVSSSVRRSPSLGILTRSAVVASSFNIGSAGLGISTFGDDIYSESVASVGFANKIGLTSIGVRADFNQLRIDGTTTRHAFGITVGCLATITKTLSLGISARNINLPNWSHGHPLPVVLNAGVAFNPGDNFLMIAEVEKDTDFDPTIKGGFEYSIRKKLFVRTGFNLFPTAAFAGMGLHVWRFGFDYALKFGYLPGYAQQVSISLKLRR